MNPTLPLKDIHLPDAINWWPPAIGWWLLAVFVPLTIYLLVWLVRRLTRKTAIKAAKKQLAALKCNTALDERQKLVELSTLLRRVAISIAPRAHSASLTGTAWLMFLDRPLKDAPFSNGIGRLLAAAPYQRQAPDSAEIEQLLQLAETWLKQCHKLSRPQS
jgi:hypothetical protein